MDISGRLPNMARKIGIAAVVGVLVGISLAAAAQDTAHGVTVLRGNNVTSEGVAIGIGTGGTETAPPNAANSVIQTGNINALRTGSANVGGEIGNPLPGAGR
jgi:hypothetical protein